jgi:Protein of unknown function (DUF3105)
MAQADKIKQGQLKPPRRSPRRRRLWVLALSIVVIATGAVAYFALRAGADLPGTFVPDLGNAHIQTPAEQHPPYNSDPPTSGPHLAYTAPWGIHTEPIAKELQIHNLEDRGVLIQYNCPSGCPDLVDKLKGIVQRYPDEVILAPYPSMPRRIALTAWTRIDTFDQFDEGRIQRFIKAYRGIDHHTR